ncbi:MAG TPA: O-antigen ligase [Rhodanobacteraceae bacterium]|nr:O-antigen ligase [Rhodanobacteraceae bacterium]
MIRSPSSTALWPPLVVLAVVVLLPVGRASELPIAIGALAAIVLFAQRRIDWRDEAIRLPLILFACYALPALISGASPVAPARTWSTVASIVRFLPFAVFAVWALRDARPWKAIVLTVAAVVSLWVIDSYVQMITGYSLAGAAEAERLSGIFGAGNLKLGPVLAVLSPFVLLAARDALGWRGLTVAFVFLAVPILLAGSRAAWLMYALAAAVVAWRSARNKRTFALALGVAVALGGIAGGIALRESPGFDARIQRSLLALGGTESAVDAASAGRLSIWRTAFAMWKAHPVTGVGVRGFRYAYPEYAAPQDHFVDTASDTGASHAHQIVLEVLSETGVVGLLFWLAGAVFAVRAWLRADRFARARAFAPALALVAMCFPPNTHLAFYSAWWGLLFWWLLALYSAALAADDA